MKTTMKKVMKNNGLVLLLLTGLLACSPAEKPNQEEKKVFRYNETAGISFLDPAYASRFEDGWAMSQIYNGLVTLDEELNVVPAIAKSWDISPDMLEYTFHLRNDVYFHDHELFKNGKGRKVTGQDFVNSFFRITDPETASPGQFIFRNLDRSDRSFNMGFYAPDDSTFKIVLARPEHAFLQQLTLPFCFVVPIEIVDHYSNDFSMHPVGTGPFKFKTWKQDVKLVLVKNENYFERDENGTRLPYIDAVAVTFIKDKDVEFREFVKGKYEFISGLHPSYQDQLLTGNGELKDKYADKFYLQRHPWLKTDYIGFLLKEDKPIMTESPLRFKQVRKAINYAINRKELVTYLRNGIGQPAEQGFVPMGMPGFGKSSIDGYNYDPEKARTLLFEAGIENPRELPAITLVATNEYKEIVEYLKTNIEAIGLKVSLDIVVPNVQKQMIASYQTNCFRKSWTADYPSGINFLQLFYSRNESPRGPNYTHFKNGVFDMLYEKALIETDNEKRYVLYHQMEEVLLEEAPVIPLYYDEVIRFVRNNVEGLSVNAMNLLELKKVRIK